MEKAGLKKNITSSVSLKPLFVNTEPAVLLGFERGQGRSL
jgi:hypothetical protein